MASRLFEGNPIGLLPITRSDTVLSQLFLTIGKMIAYTAVHEFRPLHLSEAVFYYLLNGNIEETFPYLKTEDLATGITKYYVEKVSNVHKKQSFLKKRLKVRIITFNGINFVQVFFFLKLTGYFGY